GEFGDRIGQRGIVDQRELVGASARDMAVERVIAGVDHRAGKPAAVSAHRGIEDLLRRLNPVDLAGRLRPKTLGIPERSGMDLMIAAGSRHGASPGVYRLRLLSRDKAPVQAARN